MLMSSFNLKWSLEESFPVIYLNGDITSEADHLLEETYYEIKKRYTRGRDEDNKGCDKSPIREVCGFCQTSSGA